jgi:hypothetical protein
MTAEQKIDKILDNITDIKIELAKHIVHQETHENTILKHEQSIKILEAHRNKIIGKTAILSVLLSSVFGSLGAWLIKHL